MDPITISNTHTPKQIDKAKKIYYNGIMDAYIKRIEMVEYKLEWLQNPFTVELPKKIIPQAELYCWLISWVHMLYFCGKREFLIKRWRMSAAANSDGDKKKDINQYIGYIEQLFGYISGTDNKSDTGDILGKINGVLAKYGLTTNVSKMCDMEVMILAHFEFNLFEPFLYYYPDVIYNEIIGTGYPVLEPRNWFPAGNDIYVNLYNNAKYEFMQRDPEIIIEKVEGAFEFLKGDNFSNYILKRLLANVQLSQINSPLNIDGITWNPVIICGNSSAHWSVKVTININNKWYNLSNIRVLVPDNTTFEAAYVVYKRA